MQLLTVLAEVANSPSAGVQIAIITGIFTVAGIIATGVFARFTVHPKPPTSDPDAKKTAPDATLLSYSGEQNEFMHLVIKDSKDVHERLDKFEAQIESMKLERKQLLDAFTRYISKLVFAWGAGGTMPYPEDDDFTLLEETLPADWRKRNK